MLEFSQQNNDSDEESAKAALVVGRIRPPEGLWPFLENVLATTGVERGSLIIFSQKFRGRIGVSSSRYLTGAIEESSGQTGAEAIKSLLSIKTGMFGFRPVVGLESDELNEGIAIDMAELIPLWKKYGGVGYSPADAISGNLPQQEQSENTTLDTTAVASMVAQVRQTAIDDENERQGVVSAAAQDDAPVRAESEDETALSYLDWFTDQVGDQPSMPRFKDILMPVLPRQNTFDAAATPAEQIPTYQELTSTDLAQSLQVDTVPNISVSPVAEALSSNAQSAPMQPPPPQPMPAAPQPQQATPQPQPATPQPQSATPPPQPAAPMQPGFAASTVPRPDAPISAEQKRELSPEVLKLNELLETESQRPRAWSPDELNAIRTPLRTSEQPKTALDAITMEPSARGATTGSQPAMKPGQLNQATTSGPSASGAVSATTAERIRPDAPPRSALRNPDEYAQKEPALLSRLWHEHPRIFGLVCLTVIGLVLLIIYSDQTNKDQTGIIASGRIALKRGNYEDARLLFTQAIEKKPTGHAYFYRGVAFARTGDSEHAIADLNEALKLGASETRVRTLRASIEAHMGDYDKAIDDASVVIVDDPKSAEAYQIRALCRSQRNEWEAVVKDCTAALQFCKDPEISARLYLERAFAYGKLNKNSEAEADLDKAVEAKPVQFVYMQRGDIYRKDKKFQTAVEDYTRVLEFDPRALDAYVARGISEAGLHRDDDALRDFGRALSIDPTNVEALIQRGGVHIARKEWRMAANDLEESIDLNPTIRESHQKLRVAYDHLNKTMPGRFAVDLTKDVQTASADKTEVFTLPATVKGMIDLGYKNLYGGSISDAVTCFTAAIKKEPNNATARKYLAYALMQSGSNGEAAAQFQTLSSIQPLDTKDKLAMAKCYMSAGQQDQGIHILMQAVQSDPTSVAAKADLARVYVTRGALPQAMELYRQALALARTPEERQLLENVLPSAPMLQTRPGNGQPVDPTQKKQHGGV